jgi:hypothetical protein
MTTKIDSSTIVASGKPDHAKPVAYVTLTEPRGRDILLGRGAPITNNLGNIWFRKVILANKAKYMAASRNHIKNRIACDTLRDIKIKHGGRFLRKVDDLKEMKSLSIKAGESAFVVVDDEVALLKVKQALREHDKNYYAEEKKKEEARDKPVDDDAQLQQAEETRSRSPIVSVSPPETLSSTDLELTNSVETTVGSVASDTETSSLSLSHRLLLLSHIKAQLALNQHRDEVLYQQELRDISARQQRSILIDALARSSLLASATTHQRQDLRPAIDQSLLLDFLSRHPLLLPNQQALPLVLDSIRGQVTAMIDPRGIDEVHQR